MSFHSNPVFNLKSFGLSAGALVLAGIQSVHASAPRIEIIDTTSGKAASAHFDTYDGTTYLSGSVYRHTGWTSPHVDIVLLDKKGQAFATKSVALAGWNGKPATNQRGTYAASFASAELAHAATVQVTFQNGLHTFCEKPTTCKG